MFDLLQQLGYHEAAKLLGLLHEIPVVLGEHRHVVLHCSRRLQGQDCGLVVGLGAGKARCERSPGKRCVVMGWGAARERRDVVIVVQKIGRGHLCPNDLVSGRVFEDGEVGVYQLLK